MHYFVIHIILLPISGEDMIAFKKYYWSAGNIFACTITDFRILCDFVTFRRKYLCSITTYWNYICASQVNYLTKFEVNVFSF